MDKSVVAVVAAVGLVAAGLAGWGAPRLLAEDATPSAAAPAFASAHAPARFDDPAGDAADRGVGDAGTFVGCVVGSWVTGSCLPVPATPTAGTPGPHYDILGVAFVEETADEVVLALEIATLSEGFAELRTPDALHRMSWFGVCWNDADGRCTRAAALDVMTHAEHAVAEGRLGAGAEDCNEWSWCSWSIPAEVAFGSPATITFRVPKAYAAVVGELEMGSLAGFTGWMEDATAFPMWHPGFTVHTPARHVHSHGGSLSTFGFADWTEDHALELAFQPAAAPPALDLHAPLLPAAGDHAHGAGSPWYSADMDLVGFDVYEDAGDLVSVFAVKDLGAQPTFDFDYSVALGFEGGEVWEIGWRQAQGHASGYAGRCIMEECQESFTLEVPVEITPGAPGFVAVRTPLAEIFPDGVPEGATTTLTWVMTMRTDGSLYWGEHDGEAYGDVHHAFMVDMLLGGAPYVLGSGHRAPAEAFGAGGHGH